LSERRWKLCPYCAEEILEVAVRCKHCQSDLTAPPEVHFQAGPANSGTISAGHYPPGAVHEPESLPGWLVVVFWLLTIFAWPSGFVIGIVLLFNRNTQNRTTGRHLLITTAVLFVLFVLSVLFLLIDAPYYFY